MNISYFFVAASVGFVWMAAITVQGLECLFSTPKLIQLAYEQDPGFQVAKARSRSRQVAILLSIVTAIVCLLVIAFASGSILWGFWFGLAVALAANYGRFQPSRTENQERFRNAYIDCFSDFQPPVTPVVAEEKSDNTDDDDDDDYDPEVVSVSRPG